MDAQARIVKTAVILFFFFSGDINELVAWPNACVIASGR